MTLPTRPPGLLPAIALGVGAALLTGAAIAGGPIGMLLSWFAPLPLFLSGLRDGVAALVIAVVAGFGALLLFGGPAMAITFFIIWGLPSLWFVRLALLSRYVTPADHDAAQGTRRRDWYPQEHLLSWLTGLAAGLVAIMILLLSLQPDGWRGFLDRLSAELLRRFETVIAQTGAVVPDGFAATLDQLVWIGPGLLALSWMLLLAFNGALANRILRKLGGRIVRPPFRLRDLTLPRWMVGALAITLVAAFASQGPAGFLGANLAMVLSVPPLLVGLAVLHSLLSGLWLAVFYVALALFGFPALAAILIGAADPWLDLGRRRSSSPSATE